MDGTLPLKPSAWTFALRWQSKANISNWSSLWAPPSPCPWTSTKAAKTKQGPRTPIFSQECKTHESSINQSINHSSIFEELHTYIHTAYHMGINARKKLCNFCILGVFRVLSWKLCNLSPINYIYIFYSLVFSVDFFSKKWFRPNKFSQCYYESSQEGHTRRHLKTHTGEKWNKCNQCYYASS